MKTKSAMRLMLPMLAILFVTLAASPALTTEKKGFDRIADDLSKSGKIFGDKLGKAGKHIADGLKKATKKRKNKKDDKEKKSKEND